MQHTKKTTTVQQKINAFQKGATYNLVFYDTFEKGTLHFTTLLHRKLQAVSIFTVFLCMELHITMHFMMPLTRGLHIIMYFMVLLWKFSGPGLDPGAPTRALDSTLGLQSSSLAESRPSGAIYPYGCGWLPGLGFWALGATSGPQLELGAIIA